MFAAVVRDGGWTQRPPGHRRPRPHSAAQTRPASTEVPLGPVAVFAASNFPLAFSVAGGDTASALAAGAPVIVKAHSAHPGTSELVGRAIRKAVQTHGLPEGTFSLLFGTGHDVGVALVTDPRIRAVGFTGSRQGGLALAAAANARPVPIPVYAEMSSINPVFVLPGALADRGTELGAAYIASMNTGVGQLCTSPGLVFLVDAPGADEFVQAAADAVAAPVPQPMLYPGLAAAYSDGVERLEGEPRASPSPPAESTTASLACGVSRASSSPPPRSSSPITTFRTRSSARRRSSCASRTSTSSATILDRLEGQLTATIHATPADYAAAGPLLERLELLAGRVLFNGWPTGVEVGHAVIHGGPFPATSAPSTTSVGSRAIERFLRPVSYQNVPTNCWPRTAHRQPAAHLAPNRRHRPAALIDPPCPPIRLAHRMLAECHALMVSNYAE